MMKKYFYLLLPFFALFSSYLSAQQVLFVVGDDNLNDTVSTAMPATVPELYIQDGADAFIYVQGGMTVETAAGATRGVDIVNNGGIFLDGGNLQHITPTALKLRIDKTTSGAFSITTPGALTGTTAYDVAGTVHLMNPAAQNIVSPTQVWVHNLSIDGTGGTAATRSMQAPLLVIGTNSNNTNDGKIYLEDDIMDLQGGSALVINTAEGAIERAAAGSAPYGIPGMNHTDHNSTAIGFFITGGGSSPLIRRTSNTPATPYLFPVGSSAADYRPGTIYTATADDYFMRQMGANPQTAGSFFTTTYTKPISVDPQHYWLIGARSGANSNTNVRLYETLDVINMPTCTLADFDESLGVAQKDATNLWNDEPNATAGGGGAGADLFWGNSGNAVTDGARVMETWGPGTVGDMFTLDQKPNPGADVNDCLPFPVEFLTLKAIPVNNSFIRLEWGTASELNNDHFMLERSLDGVNFSYFVDSNIPSLAPGGNSSTPLYYAKNDYNVSSNVRYYYRVRMVDIGGGFTYSNVVNAMLFDGNTHIGAVYPNPTNGDLNIQITSNEPSTYKFRLYNPLGQEIYGETVETKVGDNIFKLDLSTLAIGTYQLVVMENGERRAAIKVIKF